MVSVGLGIEYEGKLSLIPCLSKKLKFGSLHEIVTLLKFSNFSNSQEVNDSISGLVYTMF